ncbi:hypothetical protein VBQ42_18680 [Klebsiella pneumoniae]|nr:hypothetical protein [Klebsiella pneumoniae]
MTSNQLTEQQIDLLIENGYDIAHTLENLAENEINSDCFEVFSYSENGRETEWDGKITEFAQRAAKAIRHLTDATTALQTELQERRKADREPVAWTWQHLKQWHVTNDEERARDLAWDGVKVDPLYRHAQPAPVVDADDNFYSWFGREWQENYQHNQYTTAVKQMLGVMAESAWKAGRCAAMLQAEPVTTANKLGNSPVIPDGYVMVPKDATLDMLKAGAKQEMKGEAFQYVWQAMLAAAPQEVGDA